MAKQDEIAIKVDGVYKDFRLPHEKHTTVKSLFTHLFKTIFQHKTIETQHALKDISFEIKKGEFFGIVGRNGSGKSTLLKMLAGIYQPTKGKIEVNGKLVPFIELGVGFNPELTGRENVYLNGALLGFDKKQIDEMYDEIVAFAELEEFMDQKLKNYSSGMQVRLAFSMAIRAKAEILLIDEVLAVGDADFQRKCYDYFKKLKKEHITVVFITHDMGSVREYCDRAMLIDDKEVRFIGKSHMVAAKYSQLFIDEVVNDIEDSVGQDEKRWGNGNIKIIDSEAKLVSDKIIIHVKAKVFKKLSGIMYGVHIVAQDGVEVTAMNNRMINQPDLRKLHVGDTVHITWEMLNVFSDGKYFVGLTFTDETGVAYDWLVEATTFTIRRPERSTTAVLPPVRVEHHINTKHEH